MSHMGLVPVRTRVPKLKAERLARLAERNGRSVAGELRVAIDRHLEKPDDTRSTEERSQ